MSDDTTGTMRCTCRDSVTAGKAWCWIHDAPLEVEPAVEQAEPVARMYYEAVTGGGFTLYPRFTYGMEAVIPSCHKVIPLFTSPSSDSPLREQLEYATATVDASGVRNVELRDKVKRLREALELLVIARPGRINPPGIASSVHGLHCVYCDWTNDSYDAEVKHEDDCPITIARKALEEQQ